MDVKCEQCGTEYEFDDAKVTEAGIAVKCTHCGHLFRVVRHAVTAVEKPVIAEPRAPRGRRPDDIPTVTRTPAPVKPRAWAIRKERTGELMEFKDLSTLQKWILERKVTRDDEISKTGESWKPLGSIVELSSFFLVVEGQLGRSDAPAPEPPAPPAQTNPQIPLRPNLSAPPPPRGRDDLLDTGQFRLEGPAGEPTGVVPVQPTGQMPRVAPQSTPLAPSLSETGTMRRVQLPPADPTPQVTVFRTPTGRPAPLPRTESIPGFDINPIAGQPTRGNTTRGFVIGVGVTGALFAVAYFGFDRLNHPEKAAPLALHSQVASQPVSNAQSPVAALDSAARVAAGDARVLSDADALMDQALGDYEGVLQSLGQPPSDPALAARALLGKARVMLARAEHRKLAGEAAGASFDKATALVTQARALAPDLVDLDLVAAQTFRLRDDRPNAQNALDTAAGRAAGRPDYAYERALTEGSDDPGAVAERLATLPPDARSVPRVLFRRGIALERAGRRDEAIQAVQELLRASPSHAQGIDLRARLMGGVAPPSAAVPASALPVASAPPTVAAVPSAAPASVPPSAAAPPSVAAAPTRAPVRVASEPTTVTAGDDFDGLMMRGANLLENGKPEVAARLFERAGQLKPRSPEPFANLGWCYVDQRRYAEALGQFQQSLDRSPRYADALYGVAEAYEKAGKSAEAITAYHAYLDAHPTGRRSDMAKRRLERLE